VARAASAMGTHFHAEHVVLATASRTSLFAAGSASRWFQLYWPKDREVTASLLAPCRICRLWGGRGDARQPSSWAGVRAIWPGVSLPFLGAARRRNRQLSSDPAFCAALAKTAAEDMAAAVFHWAKLFSNPAATWDDLSFLRKHTRLPLVLKGDPSPGPMPAARRPRNGWNRRFQPRRTAGGRIGRRAPTPSRRSPPPRVHAGALRTAESGPVRTFARHWRWAPKPCYWDALTLWTCPSLARRESNPFAARCCRVGSHMALSGITCLKELT